MLRRARDDDRLRGAAGTGAGAEGREDAWSDIDLFFGVRAGVPVAAVIDEWSGHCYARLGAVHHFVLDSGAATYRAFLLSDGLQVDLGFAPRRISVRSVPGPLRWSSASRHPGGRRRRTPTSWLAW